MSFMMFRAIICCAALIVGLLGALNVTAQSAGACNGTACSTSGKAQPLNLMSFMNGSGKTGTMRSAAAPARTSTGRHRHHNKVKTAARSHNEDVPAATVSSEPPALPAAAATAYAANSPNDVQVVSGDEVNAIDLAMNNSNSSAAETNSSAAETNGTAPRTESDNGGRAKWADANEFRAEQFKPSAAPAPVKETTGDNSVRDDSWIGRFWSTIGDGFVALVAMVRQLFR